MADIQFLPESANVHVRAMTSGTKWRESGVIDKTVMVFGQMNETAGARMRATADWPDYGRIFP